MLRVHIICEGQTEETFVKEVLSDYFIAQEICLIPFLIGKPGHKGGNVTFERLLFDVRSRLLHDHRAYCSMFMDYYGLPADFPGKPEAERKTSSSEKADCVCQAVMQRLQMAIDHNLLRRFVPYIQMHEFEGLLFSDCHSFAKGIGPGDLSDELYAIRLQFDSPEDINGHYEIAPSKRILALCAVYDKPIYGSLAALEIGADKIREECSLFDGWVHRIASLSC